MSCSKLKQSKPHRTASIVICVLVVILLVGLLSVQTIQTLALIRRGDNDRAKILQSKELSEFAGAIDWSSAESPSLTMHIPDSVLRVGEPETQAAILERRAIADNSGAAEIVVRFPADKPGEIQTTWEFDHE